MKKLLKKSYFTLIELLVVCGIIAVSLSVAVIGIIIAVICFA